MNDRLINTRSKQSLINLSGVSKTYHNAAGTFTALEDINLQFYQGEFVGVIGKSGSGKSTLVNMITGIDRPTGGKVLINGQNIHAMKESKQARWRGLNMGVVFQFFQLLPMLSVVENVLLPMDFCDKYQPEERYHRAMELVDMVGLSEQAHQLPGSLSGGQQQSAAIARALANDPSIVVADEPTGNLDAKTADSIYDKFESLAAEGRTIIMITHDPDIEPRLSRTILLSDGEVIDPVLAKTLSFLPHSELRKLSHQLVRKTFSRGQTLPLFSSLSINLILVEAGEIQLTLENPQNKNETRTLSAGAYFAGERVMGEDLPYNFSAKCLSENTELVLLPYEAIISSLNNIDFNLGDFHKKLRDQILITKKNPSGDTGAIQ